MQDERSIINIVDKNVTAISFSLSHNNLSSECTISVLEDEVL